MLDVLRDRLPRDLLTHVRQSGRHLRLVPAVILALVAGCSASGSIETPTRTLLPSPTTRSVGGELVSEAEGLTLTVTLDRTTVAPNEVVTFRATFRNGSSEPVVYPVPSCGGAASTVVSVALPLAPAGKRWPGIAQEFKDFVLTEGKGVGGVSALAPVASVVPAFPCGEDDSDGLLGIGESVTTVMPWKAEIVPGVAALAGTVPFTVSVAYDSPIGSPSSAPGTAAPQGGLSSGPYKQLIVSGAVEVVGEGRNLASVGEVVDAVVANEKFADWLAGRPSETWSAANLFLTSASAAEGIVPAGPSWELELFREVGVPRHWAVAFIDPFDATLRSVDYCDVPCDR